MINGRTIAVAIVDTMQHTLAANAFFNSTQHIPFDQLLIYSDYSDPWGGHEIIKINPINSISEYNEIIIKKLSHDLKCDYVLIIQYDGFVINPKEFSNHFLDFDYIGAPWNHLDTNCVGNGGFSMRSKRIIEKIAGISDYDCNMPEDVYICQHLRKGKVLQDFNFATKDIASKFSFEYPTPTYPTFGFHGIFNMPFVYRKNLDYLIDNLCESIISEKYSYLYPFIFRISPEHALKLEKIKRRFDAANIISISNYT